MANPRRCRSNIVDRGICDRYESAPERALRTAPRGHRRGWDRHRKHRSWVCGCGNQIGCRHTTGFNPAPAGLRERLEWVSQRAGDLGCSCNGFGPGEGWAPDRHRVPALGAPRRLLLIRSASMEQPGETRSGCANRTHSGHVDVGSLAPRRSPRQAVWCGASDESRFGGLG